MSMYHNYGRSDRKRFRRTAVHSKKMNINPNIPRGGIRL